MVIIEVLPNPNCEPEELRVFHDVEAPRTAAKVCLERIPGELPEWYDVTGWTSAGSPCPAVAQRVDDSGEGLAVLIHGGDCGLRLKPAGLDEVWDLESHNQFGAPFLLIANDGVSITYSEVAHG